MYNYCTVLHDILEEKNWDFYFHFEIVRCTLTGE